MRVAVPSFVIFIVTIFVIVVAALEDVADHALCTPAEVEHGVASILRGLAAPPRDNGLVADDVVVVEQLEERHE